MDLLNLDLRRRERAIYLMLTGKGPRRKKPGDCIIIPEMVRNRELSVCRLSARLRNILGYRGCRVLGDLHGVHVSELAKYRNCGQKTLLELLELVEKLQQSQPSVARQRQYS